MVKSLDSSPVATKQRPEIMKTLTKSTLRISAFVVLSIFTVHAQTVAVLDGFEGNTAGMPPGTTTNGFSPGRCVFTIGKGGGPTGINFCNTNIALFTGYGSRSGLVTLTQYTATGPNDPYVTEGSHSTAVTFFSQNYGSDFQIVLSDTNSVMVEQAAQSGQIGRYILRFDVIFPNPSQYTYFNQQVFIGNNEDYLTIGGATPVYTNALYTNTAAGVYSCALELPTLGLPLPNSGTNVQFYVADDFGTTQSPFTNCTIYIDNVRLVDTYASPSTVPVIYPLISWRGVATSTNGVGPATNLYQTVTTYYGNPVTRRAHLSLYTTNGLYNPAANGIPGVCTASNQLVFPPPHYVPPPVDTDFAVTESDGSCLQVSNYDTGTGYNGYQADFAVSFAGTKLAQILSSNLPPSQLAHYTLRWDSTLPEEWSISDGDYFNLTFSTGAAALPICQSRRLYLTQTGLQRNTYSITLDQIAAWGGSPVNNDPAIIFFSDASDLGGSYTYYFGNFELIDTAPAVVIVTPTITSYQYNAATRQFTLTWASQNGENYTVQSSASLSSGFTTLVANIPSVGNTTTTTVTMPAGQAGFLRVLAQ